MTKRASPTWLLSKDWGVGTDPYNWILYRKGKKSWKAAGYYPSAELLLKSFYRKLTRIEPADPDLIRHVDALSRRAQAAAARLFEELDRVGLGGTTKAPSTPKTSNRSRHEVTRKQTSMPAAPASTYRREASFIQKHEDWLSSAAYRHLSPAARCILEELHRREWPNNNGKIGLSIRRAASLINVNKDTAGQCFKDLESHGFIRMTKEAEYQRGLAREWRLTFMPGSDGSTPTDEWKKWKPTMPQNGNGVKTNCPKTGDTTVPPIGTPQSRRRGHSNTSLNRQAQIQ